jgi:formate C-acetyltransferase
VARFQTRLWQRDVNVRWFLQQHYTLFEGDGSFLAPATDRTKRIWKKLQNLFLEERKKGVLDISQIPSSITAHAPGYIDRENEVIVGLQTEAPLKRAIMPMAVCAWFWRSQSLQFRSRSEGR